MAAEIIDCKAIAATIKGELTKQVAAIAEEGLTPRLAVIVAGDDAASAAYVRGKQRDSAETGIASDLWQVPGEGEPAAIEAAIRAHIERLNADPAVDGMILQLPLPEDVYEDALIETIDPRKDVDGLHPENLGLLVQGAARYLPATPHGVQQILVRSGNDPGGKHVVIVGRSRLVGLPLANMLVQKRAGANATVTLCHTSTPDLAGYTRAADILVAAAGVPGLITADMVRPGAVVIDVGISRVDDPSRKRGYRLAGDVDFEAVAQVARAITPVPGGVGLMTRAMLLTNVVRAARQFRGR
ncbi:MAG: bifunctional 5,10-methylenetetrahydrofolate dehydrogenase/5,10-methenyltetrahydrofolate cyclohydrolase [Chloroflexi bacterium]|nr:bifunctional 5,10-methylenetetrahydrofolate dehydrogenase/5,10-methenyltetrahydrofolate cyclohydrolase [Chloroflexota bacterium]